MAAAKQVFEMPNLHEVSDYFFSKKDGGSIFIFLILNQKQKYTTSLIIADGQKLYQLWSSTVIMCVKHKY